MITKKKFPMNLLRLLKTGTWKIPCTLLLAGRWPWRASIIRPLPGVPAAPAQDKTAYLEKRAAWEPHRRTFHHNGAKLSGWLIEKEGATPPGILRGNAMDISMMLPYLDRFPMLSSWSITAGTGSAPASHGTGYHGRLLAILDSVLKETGRTPDDVILVGQSLGSGVATQVASVRHVKKENWCCWFLLTAFWKPPETLFPYLPVRLLASGPLPVGPGRAQSRLPCQHSGRGSG